MCSQASVSDPMGLEDVDAILDCDGFELAGVDTTKTSVSPHIARIPGQRKAVFLCREMAIAILKDHEPFISKNAFFEMPTINLAPQHCRTIEFGKRLHDLPWRTQYMERIVHPQKQLEAVMRQWYEIVKETSRKTQPVVAYKGGHYECDLLTVMNIPTCNIEQWDCPKVEEVAARFPQVQPKVHICYQGNHSYAKDLAAVHCPKFEVALFAEFLAARWKELKRDRKRRRNQKAAERRIKRRQKWLSYTSKVVSDIKDRSSNT